MTKLSCLGSSAHVSQEERRAHACAHHFARRRCEGSREVRRNRHDMHEPDCLRGDRIRELMKLRGVTTWKAFLSRASKLNPELFSRLNT